MHCVCEMSVEMCNFIHFIFCNLHMHKTDALLLTPRSAMLPHSKYIRNAKYFVHKNFCCCRVVDAMCVVGGRIIAAAS